MKKAAALLALLWISSGTVLAQDIFEEEAGLFTTRELTASVAAVAESRITIRSAATLNGSIVIETSENKEVRLRYVKKAKTGSRSHAIDFIDLIAVSLERAPGGAKLEMRAPNPAPWSGAENGLVEIRLTVPEFCDLEIEAQFFDIVANGPFAKFIVPASLGRLEVENVTEKLELATSNRRVTISDISGEVNVSTTNSTLEAEGIHSPDKQIVLRNEGGDIKVLGLSGELNAKNSYGRIEVEQFKPSGKKNFIRNFHGPIIMTITDLKSGQLLVTNRFEDIDLTLPSEVSAEIALAVEDEGKIEVSSFPFKPELVQRNRLHLRAGEGSSLINGSIRGKGNIYLRASAEGD